MASKNYLEVVSCKKCSGVLFREELVTQIQAGFENPKNYPEVHVSPEYRYCCIHCGEYLKR